MKAAVLGTPISHSLSPVLHLAAYAQLGLSHSYEAIEMDERELPVFISQLDSTWLGFSLTMPLKEAAFLVATETSEMAKLTYSINTLVLRDGIFADNTDVYGIAQSVREATSTKPKSALIIGAGATARSAIAALNGLGTSSVVVLARNQIKAASCIDLGNTLGITIDTTDKVSDSLFATDLVINTTPSGVADQYVGSLSLAKGVLLDVIYSPWPTELARAWSAKRLEVIPGYEMLLHQAVRQVELMTGQFPDVENMRSLMLKALATRN
jgi:shikimate dehydrogenase